MRPPRCSCAPGRDLELVVVSIVVTIPTTCVTCHPRPPMQPQRPPPGPSRDIFMATVMFLVEQALTWILLEDKGWALPLLNLSSRSLRLIIMPWTAKSVLALDVTKLILLPSHHCFAGKFSNPPQPPTQPRQQPRPLRPLGLPQNDLMLSIVLITPTTI